MSDSEPDELEVEAPSFSIMTVMWRILTALEQGEPAQILMMLCVCFTGMIGATLACATGPVVHYDAAAEKHWASGRCRVQERHLESIICGGRENPIGPFYLGWLDVALADARQTFLGNFSAFKKPSFQKNCGGVHQCGRGRHCFNAKRNAKRFLEKYTAGQTYGCDYDPDDVRNIAMKNNGSGLVKYYIAGLVLLCLFVCCCCAILKCRTILEACREEDKTRQTPGLEAVEAEATLDLEAASAEAVDLKNLKKKKKKKKKKKPALLRG